MKKKNQNESSFISVQRHFGSHDLPVATHSPFVTVSARILGLIFDSLRESVVTDIPAHDGADK